MTIEVRATRPEEYRAAATAFVIPLMEAPPDDERWEQSLPTWEVMPSYSAWDGDRCVGHAGHFLVDTTVPGGGRLATGAVSRVGILPTHRRRGLATRLMRALVDDATERELPLMSLRASEAVIYGRFGFGVAGECHDVEIDATRALPLSGAASAGSFRVLDPSELLEVIPHLYERVAHRRPGVITRTTAWWPRLLRDATEQKKASFVVVHLDEVGTPDGYAHYEPKWNGRSFADSSGEAKIHDLFAVDDGVELALWQFLLGLDLVTTWTAEQRPVDDLVRHATHDRRAYQPRSIADEQWMRIVDVDRALGARTYNDANGSVVIGVSDPWIASNNGSWRVSSAGAERSRGNPDLTVAIETLSAAYLGGPSWATLAGAGEVEVRTPPAIASADALFASRPLPFCGTFF
jgi:predicted acetyltransferase